MIVPLPWSKPPLSLNDRGCSPWVKANLTRQAIEDARAAIAAANVPALAGAELTLHYRPKDRRRRDADNLAPTLKACQDALVPDVLPDDSWVHIPAATCRIHPPIGAPAVMWLELTNTTYYEEPAS